MEDIADLDHIVTASGQVCWEAITFNLRTLDNGNHLNILKFMWNKVVTMLR